MGFWKKFGKYAIPIGAGLATVFTGGAAAPLLGMALGAGSGLASAKLGGASWKNALISAGVGGALGGVGGGALKGMGGVGKFLGTKGGQAALQGGGAIAKQAAAPPPEQQMAGMGYAPRQMQMLQRQPMNYPDPGMVVPRRAQMAGMGTRMYG